MVDLGKSEAGVGGTADAVPAAGKAEGAGSNSSTTGVAVEESEKELLIGKSAWPTQAVSVRRNANKAKFNRFIFVPFEHKCKHINLWLLSINST